MKATSITAPPHAPGDAPVERRLRLDVSGVLVDVAVLVDVVRVVVFDVGHGVPGRRVAGFLFGHGGRRRRRRRRCTGVGGVAGQALLPEPACQSVLGDVGHAPRHGGQAHPRLELRPVGRLLQVKISQQNNKRNCQNGEKPFFFRASNEFEFRNGFPDLIEIEYPCFFFLGNVLFKNPRSCFDP